MGLSINRKKTTKLATAKINDFLDREDFTSALLLASIYVHMRLKTLITLRLNPPQKHWRDISNSFNSANSPLGYNSLLNVCNKLDLVENEDKNRLKQLWNMRNSIAHETELWKTITERKQQEIIELCHYATEFLKNTNN
jgi:hypothetical protein